MAKEKVLASVEAEIKPKKSVQFLKYSFSREELEKIGQELAMANIELSALEQEKKAVVSTFSSKIAGKEAQISTLSNNINSGFEHRNVNCVTEYNTPNTGMKRTTRLDTGEIIETVSMTQEEMQLKLEMDEVSSEDDDNTF